jgi:uncharacterized protein YycO
VEERRTAGVKKYHSVAEVSPLFSEENPVKLAFYKGTSWVSLAIRWQTRGRYSHVGVVTPDGKIIESWHRGGVLKNASLGMRHDPQTEVDIYSVTGLNRMQNASVLEFMENQLGKKYDFLSVARFISRREVDDQEKWFCSELVMAAFHHAASPLLNVASHKVSPEVLSWSPRLKFEFTTTT